MIAPLPVWAAYAILAAMGAGMIALALLVRKLRGRSNDVRVWPRGRPPRRLPPY